MICYEYLGLLFTSYYLLVGWWSSEMTVGELCLVEASELVTCGCLRLFCIFCSMLHLLLLLPSPKFRTCASLDLLILLLISVPFLWAISHAVYECVCSFVFFLADSLTLWMNVYVFICCFYSLGRVDHTCVFLFFFVLARAVYECVCSFFLRARARYQYMLLIPLFFLLGQSRALFMYVWVLFFIYFANALYTCVC